MRPTALTRVVAVVLLALAALAPAAHAADRAFQPRWAKTVHGTITAVGNTSLTCPPAAANCAAAKNGSPFNNNDFNMINVDVDADAATANSSSATVSLPAGSTVEWAGLYWSADTAAASGGVAAANAALKDRVKLAVDGGAYTTVVANAADVLTSSITATRYVGFADVTSLLPAAGNGTITVADIQAGTGVDRYAGWGLIVGYRDANQPLRRLNVFDGLGTVNSTTSFTTTVGPFLTPKTGPVTTTIGLLAHEGDAGYASETVTLDGKVLSNALNPANNFLNSTLSVDGVDMSGKNPDQVNQLGTDLDVITSTGLLDPDQSSAVLKFTSGQEYYMPSAFFLVSDEGPAYSVSGPSVSGTARDGSTLTANPGSWNGTPTITYTYQWQRCDGAAANCADVPGATAQTLPLTGADIGSTFKVRVVAHNDAGDSAPATSSVTGAVAVWAPENVTVPVVTGTNRAGETLTTTYGTWDGTGPLGYSIHWQRCDAAGANCQLISGATGTTYVLTDADVAGTVRSVVTASNSAGTAFSPSTTTTAIAPAPPVNTLAPSITGPLTDGATLTADKGTWSGTPTITYGYQWRRCDAAGANCADIAGATGTTYVLTHADVDGTVQLRVTATNAAGSAAEATTPSTAVAPAPPVNQVPATVSGTLADGETVTAGQGSWTGTPVLTYTYQWQRCDAAGANCADIAGATAGTYKLVAADAGGSVRVVVTATNAAGHASAPSATRGPVAAAPAAAPAAVPAAEVAGAPTVGEALVADTSAWQSDLPATFDYQWLRCDAAGEACVEIDGASGRTYSPTDRDSGAVLRVKVTATTSAGRQSFVTGPTAVIAAATTPVAEEPAVPAICRQLAGNARYRRIKARGIGTVRVRAYATSATAASSPIRVTTQITGGRARKVDYRLDGKRLVQRGTPLHEASIVPARIATLGRHVLRTVVTGRKGHKRVVRLVLPTIACKTQFVAQRWRTTAGAGLRLRVDARSAIGTLRFGVPARLLPEARAAKRGVGFLRVFRTGMTEPRRLELSQPRRGAKGVLLRGRGKPTVRRVRGGLAISRLPRRTQVAELTIYRVTTVDGRTAETRVPLRVRVKEAAATLRLRSKPAVSR